MHNPYDWWNTHEYGYELFDEFHIGFGITFVTYEFPDRPDEKIGDVSIHSLELGDPSRPWCFIRLPWEN